jgi:gliding motility-associated-like protein/uncharacterized repeat protein (TIGR01451 family)
MVTSQDVPTAGSCPQEQVIVRTWTATDECGNSSTASQEITIEDKTAPVFNSVPLAVTISCEDAMPTTQPTVTDNCSSNIMVTSQDVPTPGSCPQEQVIIRTWTATDECGNSSTASQEITIEDNTAPLFTFIPADVTISCTDPIPGDVPLVSDNCDQNPVFDYQEQTIPGNCGANFSIIKTWIATDACGNSSTVSQTITVQDINPPSILIEAEDLQVECDGSGNSMDFTEWLNTRGGANAEDDCLRPLIWTNNSSGITFACGYTGSEMVVFTVTDQCGNSSSTTATFTIVDSTPPVFSNIPGNITINCNDPLPADQPIVTDACSNNVSLTFNDQVEAGSCANENTITRVWTATDECGNTSTASQEIFVVDNTPPVLLGIPANQNMDCGGNPDPVPLVSATDDCDPTVDISMEEYLIENGCGTILTRIWTATDNCGNTSTGSQIISLVDAFAPEFSNVPNDLNLECGATIPFSEPMVTDNCDPDIELLYIEETVQGNCFGSETLTRTWIATDECGNSASVSQVIQITDSTSPDLIGVPNDTMVACGGELPMVPNVTAFDACDANVQVDYEEKSGSNSCAGEILRIWTAMDDCGNSIRDTQRITLVDNYPPVYINFPPNITIDCSDTIPFTRPMAMDVCSGLDSIWYLDEVENGFCPQNQLVKRTWYAQDNCGNIFSRIQEIEIRDISAPEIQILSNPITINCDLGTGTLPQPIISDNCDPNPTLTWYDSGLTGDCANGLMIERTWVVADACGNFSTANQTILIIDTVAPQIISNLDPVTVDCNNNLILSEPIVQDNCDDNPDITYTDIPLSGNCPNGFSFLRTWTVTDDCGNQTSGTQEITITDSESPVFLSDFDPIEIDCNFNPAMIPVPDAIDNCDNDVTITYSDGTSTGNCSMGSIRIRTWIASDDCGNQTTATQTITIIDRFPPQFVNPLYSLTIDCSDGPDQIPIPTVTDNCDPLVDVTFTDLFLGGDCFSGKRQIRTWTATDDCGNSSSFDQVITIIDDQGPVFTYFPDDLTISCGSIPLLRSPEIADNCDKDPTLVYTDSFVMDTCENSGLITRVWTASDLCGNTTTRIQTITINDDTPPFFTIPNLPDIKEKDLLAFPYPLAFDDCDDDVDVTFFDSGVTGNCDIGRQYIRTWVATDNCGNSTTTTQTVLLEGMNVENHLAVTICDGESYFFNSQQLSVSGIYRDTILGGTLDGCDSIIILSLSVEYCGGPFQIGDFVWSDDNMNGIQDLGETGISGIEIQLWSPGQDGIKGNNDDVLFSSEFTDLNGFYAFAPGVAGPFYLQLNLSTVPQNYQITLINAGNDDNLDSDANSMGMTDLFFFDNIQDDLSFDFGLFEEVYDLALTKQLSPGQTGMVSIGEDVYYTITVLNEGNLPVSNLTIKDNIPMGMELSPLDLLWNLVSSNEAEYTFLGVLLPGETFSVEIIMRVNSGNPGQSIINTAEIKSVTDSDGNAIFDIDSEPNNGIPNEDDIDSQEIDLSPNAISGFIYCEEDGSLLTGGVISVTGPNGIPDTQVNIVQDGSNGYYEWYPIGTPGIYTLSYTHPNGFTISQVCIANGAAFDPTGYPNPLTLGSDTIGTNLVDADCAQNPYYLSINWQNGDPAIRLNNLPLACTPPSNGIIGDYVWNDLNQNGIQDAGEPGVGNVEVQLFTPGLDGIKGNNDDVLLLTTSTNASGFYQFDQLQEGLYYVIFNLNSLPQGFVISPSNIGNDTLDSDGNAMGMTDLINLSRGEVNLTVDFGFYLQGANGNISGQAWKDCDDDGIRESGEMAFPNVLVNLHGLLSNGQTLDLSLQTDVNGNYSFSGLPEGDYFLQFVAPTSGFEFVPDGQGADPNTDSDANPSTGLTSTFHLNPGASEKRDVGFDDVEAPVFSNIPADTLLSCETIIPSIPVVMVSDNCDGTGNSCEVETGDNFSLNVSGGNLGDPDFSIHYLLTDENNTIVQILTEPNRTFTNLPSGNLKIFTLSYEIAEGVSGLIIGNGVGDITGDCFDISSYRTLQVCQNIGTKLIVDFEETIVDGNCPGNYQIIRSWTSADACGNETTVSQTISVVDTTAPVITPIHPIFNGVSSGDTLVLNCSNVPRFISEDAVAIDNCDPNPTMILFDERIEIGDCEEDGYQMFMVCYWSAIDHCDNESRFYFYVKVVDNEAPVLSNVPSDTLIYCDQPVPGPASVTAYDNCTQTADLDVSLLETFVPDCGSSGIITRTWMVSDDCGNFTSSSQTIQVIDTTGPVIIGVPTDPIFVSSRLNVPGIPAVDVYDHCDDSPLLVFTETVDYNDCIIRIQRSWEATDACGNVSSASYTIIVEEIVDGNLVKLSDVSCAGNDGAAEISPLIAGYSNIWQDGDTNTVRNNLSPGIYMVTITSFHGCEKLDTIEILDDCLPDCIIPVIANLKITPSGCGLNNGEVTIDLVGNDSNYVFNWFPNQGISANSLDNHRTDLPPGIYLVTANYLGKPDCFDKFEVIVTDDCPTPLPVAFYDDFEAFPFDCSDNGVQYCLNIPWFEKSNNYSLQLDGKGYDGVMGGCNWKWLSSYNIADLVLILDSTTLDIELKEWTVNGNYFSGSFSSMEDLIAFLNDVDPEGNWKADYNCINLIGGTESNIYGNMVLEYKGLSYRFQPNTGSLALGTQLQITGNGWHELIVTRQNDGASDTLQLYLACLTKDTIYSTISVSEKDTICLTLDELAGNQTYLETNAATNLNGLANLSSSATENCLVILGQNPGNTSFEMIICDEFGICDTTLVVLTVISSGEPWVYAVNDTARTLVNTPVLIDVGLNDVGFTGSPELNIISVPRFGTVEIIQGTKLEYTPMNGYCNSRTEASPDWFDYEICSNGICDDARVFIGVNCNSIIVYNGISPNYDGHNDELIIEGLDSFEKHQIHIYNRWGNEVFSSSNYQNNWDGTFEGKALPDGTYFYLVKLNDEITITGYIQIQK